MKRDPELIRLLLLEVESGEKPEAMSRYTEDEILYHCSLLIEGNLVVGQVARNAQGIPKRAVLQRLTWGGHDFIDAARDETVWNQALKKGKSVGGSWTLEGLKLILFELVRRSIS